MAYATYVVAAPPMCRQVCIDVCTDLSLAMRMAMCVDMRADMPTARSMKAPSRTRLTSKRTIHVFDLSYGPYSYGLCSYGQI